MPGRLAWSGLVGFLVVPLLGCQIQTLQADARADTAASTYRLEMPATPAATVHFVDARPLDQKVTALTGDPFGTILTLGDDATGPRGIDVFERLLANRLGGQLEGKTITLDQFAVQVFFPYQVRNAEIDSLIAGGVMNPLKVFLAHVKAAPGQLAGLVGAQSQKSNLVGTRISGWVDGREFFVRHDEAFRTVSEHDVHRVIAKALDKAIAEIARSNPQ